MNARIAAVIAGLGLACAVGSSAAQDSKPPTGPQPGGPVQGYQGGYDQVDKSKAPAVKSGAPNDTANADEGGGTRQVTGRVARVDNGAMTLTLDDGRAFALPPTVQVDPEVLKPGTLVRISIQRRDRADLVTAVQIAEGSPR